MKPARGWIVWSALALCAALVLGAMTWLTRGVLAAERKRASAETRADLEERTRLALWRMDALGAAIMLRENRFPADPGANGQAPPDPANHPPEVLLRFQIREGGVPTSPELDAIRPGQAAAHAGWIGERRQRLQNLRDLLAANPLPGDAWAQLSVAASEGQVLWLNQSNSIAVGQNFNATLRLNNKNGEALRQDSDYQERNNDSERAQRAKAVAQTVDNGYLQGGQQQPDASATEQPATEQPAAPQPAAQQPAAPAAVSQLRGVWVGGELFLLRQVVWNLPETGNAPAGKAAPPARGKQSAVQGVWLDSRALRKILLAEVADLLPQACLSAVATGQSAGDSLAMVAFPFRLERNEVPGAAPPSGPSAFGVPLWVAWAAVTLAVLASSLLVRGVMRLSERRASFVSAVTHELRTPLTTFRLYSEMLESGAVKEEKRGAYLRVLSREADRLAHLVENVLAFSRIERGTARSSVRNIAVHDLLEISRERLEARLATAGLSLEIASAGPGLRVRVDTAAIEHILFNLIDNAAKYASTSNPPRVSVSVRAVGRAVEIAVCDHGPGIPPAERVRIFRAFHKSAREAAESQPGVGLGLALSRRLAKAQGGDLSCADTAAAGACFILRLPAA